jgi:4-hydroxymandelate oxidase
MDELISLADFEAAARRSLDPGTDAYYAGGAGDEITLADNVAAWRRLAILPRMLAGVERRNAEVTLLGRRRPHPLLIAPMALHGLAHPDGELATARAAAATGAVLCVSTFASRAVGTVTESVPDASCWFQLYVFNDRGRSAELVAQAKAAGCEALVVTIDFPVRGAREREDRAPIAADLGVVPAALTTEAFTALIDAGLTWKDIEQFAADSQLPVLVKGVLTAEDARVAAAHGVSGVIVSNHGGRQLDTVLAGADALPAIAEAVGDQLDVLVDGGIRRGTDVLKALALGARAVMVGRPVLWGLAVGGAEGAQRVLEILLREFDTALALAGARRADELDSSLVTRAPWA